MKNNTVKTYGSRKNNLSYAEFRKMALDKIIGSMKRNHYKLDQEYISSVSDLEVY